MKTHSISCSILRFGIVLQTIFVFAFPNDVKAQIPTAPSGIIAFDSNLDWDIQTEEDEDKGIYLMSGEGKQVTRLSKNSTSEGVAQLSRDGKRLVFTSARDGNTDIYLWNLFSSSDPVQRVTRFPTFETSAALDKSGKRVAFILEADQKDDYEHYLCLIDVNGSNFKKIVDITGYERPSFNADGSKLLYSSIASSDKGNYGIYTINLDGTDKSLCSNRVMELN